MLKSLFYINNYCFLLEHFFSRFCNSRKHILRITCKIITNSSAITSTIITKQADLHEETFLADHITTNLVMENLPASNVIPLKGLCIVLLLNSIIAGLYLLITKNPIYSLLSLIAVFLNSIILLLTLKIEFLALSFLIIYVGAIAILFLFVLMMFNLKKLQNIEIVGAFWYTFFIYVILLSKVYPLVCGYIKNFMFSLNASNINMLSS